jgi:hypothetical protein
MSARRKLKPEAYTRVLDPSQKWQVKKGTQIETGDVEDRWFRKPNILWDAQRDRVICGLSALVAEFLLMNKAHLVDGCCLSLSSIARGCNVFESQVVTSIAEFTEGGFLKVLKRGNKNVYKLDLKALAVAKPREVIPPRLEVVPKAAATEDEEEEDVESEQIKARTAPTAKPQKVIASGRIAPLTLRIPIKSKPGKYEDRAVEVLNRDIAALAFACTTIKGRPYLEVWRPGFAALFEVPVFEGEETAKNPTNGLVGSKRTSTAGFTDSARVIVKSEDEAVTKHLAALTAQINAVLKTSYKHPPATPAFAAKIAAAGPDVDPKRFYEYATQEVAKQVLKGRELDTNHLTGFARQLQAEALAGPRIAPDACEFCEGAGVVLATVDGRGAPRRMPCRDCGGSGKAAKARGAS